LPEPSKLILVTGANGFVGSHLTEKLLAKGYRVRCLVRRTSDLAFVRGLPVEWSYADVSEPAGLAEACQGVDAVCHCAGLTRALDASAFFRVNTEGTVALARGCTEGNPGVKRFLFLSSHAAAGPSSTSSDYIDESRPSQPITWYGQSKLAAEQALLTMGDRLPVTILRPSAVFGPRDKDFASYFEMVHRGIRLLLGRRERLVCFVYVCDLVDAILLALESDRAVGQTYFVCGPAVSYAEFCATIARALGKRTVGVSVPVALLGPLALYARAMGRLTGKPALLNEQRILDLRQPYWLCSGEKAQRELGFVAAYRLDTAIQETADWYRDNGWI
jgi:dihydroflavonol-4-reductase